MPSNVPYECGDPHMAEVDVSKVVCTVKYLNKWGEEKEKDVPGRKKHNVPCALKYRNLPGLEEARRIQKAHPLKPPEPGERRSRKLISKGHKPKKPKYWDEKKKKKLEDFKAEREEKARKEKEERERKEREERERKEREEKSMFAHPNPQLKAKMDAFKSRVAKINAGVKDRNASAIAKRIREQEEQRQAAIRAAQPPPPPPKRRGRRRQ